MTTEENLERIEKSEIKEEKITFLRTERGKQEKVDGQP